MIGNLAQGDLSFLIAAEVPWRQIPVHTSHQQSGWADVIISSGVNILTND